MPKRTLIINPGSTSWWLLSLSPVLFFDRIEIDPNEIKDVLDHGDRSSYDERAAQMMELILRNPEEQILYENKKLPPRGETKALDKESERISSLIIKEASHYSPTYPSLVRPGELKNMLRLAYHHWVRFNRLKARILHKTEPLYSLLTKEQIPQSLGSLQKIEKNHARKIPELLEADKQLKTVLKELVRNALLITDLGKESIKRVYDGLIDEFLPTIEIVERLRVFKDLPGRAHEALDINLLTELYNFRLMKIRSLSKEKLDLTEAFYRALKERKKLQALRLRITEFDTLISERDLKPDQALKSVFTLVKDINKTVKLIDSIGTWAMYGTGAYLLGELLSSLSPSAQFLLKSAVLNPLTAKATKEFAKNYYTALSGLSPKSSSYISIIRDYVAVQPYSRPGMYRGKPNVFKFWV